MLAYYLLGRTYADAGEAPRSIEAYNTAAERADTTSYSCDLRTLSRVYTQLAQLYYSQLLPDNMIREERRAMKFAEVAKDTMCYLACYAMLAEGYDMKNLKDSALLILSDAYSLYNKIGAVQMASALCCSMANICRQQKDYLQTEKYLLEYETRSGFFDECGNVEHGKEMYYSCKGLLCLDLSDRDNAEYYFRKLYGVADNYYLKIAALDGLQRFYTKYFNKDSLVKYVHLSDSICSYVHNEVEMQKTLQVQALYDYTWYEHEAQQETERAIRTQLRFVITAVIALLFLILAMLIAYRYREVQKKRLEEKLHYQQLLDSHGRTEKELSELRAHQGEQTLKELITQKEQELSRLDAELAHYRRKSELMTEASSDEERLLRAFPFYQNLLHTTDQGHSLTANDWKAIRKFLQEHLPQFYRYMSDNSRDLTNYEYQVCLLVRLHLKPKSIANALGVDGSYVTRVRRSMVKKLFGVDVSSKEADMLVLQIDRLKATEAAD
jgi:hypothetical protein